MGKVDDLLQDATIEQRKWVIARLSHNSDLRAAQAVGLHRNTVGSWPNKAKLDEAVMLLLTEPREAALAIIQDALTEAARIKAEGLKSKKEEVAQSAASEILDRVLGKPTQRQEVTGANGGPIETNNAQLTDAEQLAVLAALFERLPKEVPPSTDG